MIINMLVLLSLKQIKLKIVVAPKYPYVWQRSITEETASEAGLKTQRIKIISGFFTRSWNYDTIHEGHVKPVVKWSR